MSVPKTHGDDLFLQNGFVEKINGDGVCVKLYRVISIFSSLSSTRLAYFIEFANFEYLLRWNRFLSLSIPLTIMVKPEKAATLYLSAVFLLRYSLLFPRSRLYTLALVSKKAQVQVSLASKNFIFNDAV